MVSTNKYGDDVVNLDSIDVDDMNVSHDCELNLSSNFKLNSFKETSSHDQWKELI